EQEAAARRGFGTGRPPQQPAQMGLDIAPGAALQVGDLHQVAKQIVAVELDQGVEVEEDAAAADGDDDPGQMVQQSARQREPPDDNGQGPQKQLEIASGQRPSQPFRFVLEQPGVGDIAVKARHQQQQQETDFGNSAAVVLAGQPVGRLVAGGDGQER